MTRRGEVGVANAILFERSSRVVSRAPVDFHDQALLAPEEVHLEALHMDIGLGLGEVVVAAQREEHLLELRAGASAAGPVFFEDAGEHAGAAAPRDGAETRAVESQVLGFVDGPLESAPGQNVGEVDDRAGGGCDGDAVDGGAVVGGDVGAVDEDALGPPIAWDRHVKKCRYRPKSPELGRASVAQNRTFSTGESGGHQLAIAG